MPDDQPLNDPAEISPEEIAEQDSLRAYLDDLAGRSWA